MPDELAFLTIAEVSRLIEQKKLSPVELTTELIRRTQGIDPQLNTYLLLTAERALDQARQAEREIAAGNYRGPMHGVPFGLKDIYSTAGIRTTGHSQICLDTVPTADATTVKKLYEAGAVLTGKLATHEFAHGGPSFDLPWPPARNPWNREHFTGGSSSGSGAAGRRGLSRRHSAPTLAARSAAPPLCAGSSVSSRPMASSAGTASTPTRSASITPAQ